MTGGMWNTSKSPRKMADEFSKLKKENTSQKEDCNLCKESSFKVGEKTGYGVVVLKIGNADNGWFASLSPLTGGLQNDFTIQLQPFMHLTHFCQLENNQKSAANYGLAFSKVSHAMTKILMDDEGLKSVSATRETGISITTYGKSTSWKDKKEHLHLKVFPFRGAIGQPYTVDSTFGKKEIFKEENSEFVKMAPVKKVKISQKRFEDLKKRLIALLK